MQTPVWNLKEQFETYKQEALQDSTSFFDCMLAEYLLCEGRYFFTKDTTFKKYGVSSLEELYPKQKAALEALPKMNELFTTIEMPLIKVLWQMEQHGINIDKTQLEKLGKLLDSEIQKIVAEIDQESGMPINLGSPMQVGKMLVETFHVPLQKTKTGKYATGEAELANHSEKFPIIQKLLKYRQLSKLKSTYVEGLLKTIGPNGRIHTTYNQAGAITGRLSSSKPNLQNIPVSSEIGKQIKSCFIPSPGHMLVAFDYSQQELRILAHITKEQTLIDAFAGKKDIHTVTASTLFKIPYEEVTKEQRYMAKTINFGVLYGMGSFGLSQTMGITPEEASTFIADFFNNFAAVRTFYTGYIADAGKNKYAETLLGRRRYVAELDNATKRELANFPIQGAAADLMKKAMIDVDTIILTKYTDVRLMLQIHDELVFEIPETSQEKLELFIADVSQVMEHTYRFDVPMKVEAKWGKNWGEMSSSF